MEEHTGNLPTIMSITKLSKKYPYVSIFLKFVTQENAWKMKKNI